MGIFVLLFSGVPFSCGTCVLPRWWTSRCPNATTNRVISMVLPERKAVGLHDSQRQYPRYSPECVEEEFCEVHSQLAKMLREIMSKKDAHSLEIHRGFIAG
jgi:hypothetical protein